MNIKNYLISGLSVILMLIVSCKNDEPKPDDAPVNETELITTMLIQLKDSADGTLKTFIYRDTDGDGGNPASRFDTIRLSAGHSYAAELFLLDESKAITDTISNEVKEEADDHIIIYKTQNVNLDVSISDMDSKLLPLGLQSIWRCGNVSAGSIKITLKHQPGIKNGNPEPGETDAELDFICLIE